MGRPTGSQGRSRKRSGSEETLETLRRLRNSRRMENSILTRLRESTATAHQEMEDQMDMQAACKDAEQYRRILAGFLGYYEPLEKRL